MEKIKFYKMQASGNDFVVINNIDSQLSFAQRQLSNLAKNICQRKICIGADGLLLLEPSNLSDFKMRIFNPDGCEVEMCGNGLRCVGLLAKKEKIILGNDIKIETLAGIKEATVINNKVRVNMDKVEDMKLNFNLEIGSNIYKTNYLNTGVAHIVIFVDDLDDFPVCKIGRAIRYHKNFEPEGTNVDFAKVVNRDTINIRTYERGVEDETLACGTGVVAVAIIAYKLSLVNSNKVKVHTKGGEVLKVDFDIKNGKFWNIYLEGKADLVYTGEMNIE